MKEAEAELKSSIGSTSEAPAETFDEKEARTREFLVGQIERLVALRTKDREFHGLEREFLYAQAELLQLYQKSKDIKHPRDVGNAREAILGRFLAASGYLPKKYSVSNTSVRVVSTEGFISREIDILLFDPETSVVLMQREDAYQVYAAESAYGAIQVKSKLTQKEIKKAFENIASYKKLRKVGIQHSRSERGFGIIFAYDTDLEWMQLVDAVKTAASEVSRSVLPNLVVVLNKGYFLFGEGGVQKLRNVEIETIHDLQVFGNPDRQGRCLYDVYSIMMRLLQDSEAPAVPLDRYFHLPLTAGKHSYEFAWGFFAELGSCEEHGDYLRQISEEALDKVLAFCRTVQPVEYLEALSQAYGNSWIAQPSQRSKLVWIYNPDGLALSDILVTPGGTLAFDEIFAFDVPILIPHFYSVRDGIVARCKSCSKMLAGFQQEKQTKA